MKEARLLIVVIGVVLPTLARIPAYLLFDQIWLAKDIAWGDTLFLEGALAAVVWAPIVIFSLFYRSPRYLSLPAVMGFVPMAVLYALPEHPRGPQTLLSSLLFLLCIVPSVLAGGGIGLWLDRRSPSIQPQPMPGAHRSELRLKSAIALRVYGFYLAHLLLMTYFITAFAYHISIPFGFVYRRVALPGQLLGWSVWVCIIGLFALIAWAVGRFLQSSITAKDVQWNVESRKTPKITLSIMALMIGITWCAALRARQLYGPRQTEEFTQSSFAVNALGQITRSMPSNLQPQHKLPKSGRRTVLDKTNARAYDHKHE